MFSAAAILSVSWRAGDPTCSGGLLRDLALFLVLGQAPSVCLMLLGVGTLMPSRDDQACTSQLRAQAPEPTLYLL